MSDNLLKQLINWIDSDEQLEACCTKWQDCSLLALDTEFVRTTTYYPIAGLIQVNDGVATYLIDPKAIDDWYPLIEIFDDEQRMIAMHSCSEDLEVMQLEIGSVPAAILDTQLALGFLGRAASMGYAAAVREELDVDIPKAETRSDWLQRPLSEPQLKYAALDVEYLFQLAQKIIKDLNAADRMAWVQEEGRNIYKSFKRLQNANDSYKRVKSAWKLSSRKLSVLMELARWRENFAQQKNIPRNRVVKERVLFELALHCPGHISQLRKIDGISDGLIRTQGATIIQLIRTEQEKDEAELPKPMIGPLAKSDQEKYKVLKAGIGEIAESMNIAPELVLRKKQIEALFRLAQEEQWDEVDDFFEGWRKQTVADRVVGLLKQI